jgi:thiamine biosynthesis lipoprotein
MRKRVVFIAVAAAIPIACLLLPQMLLPMETFTDFAMGSVLTHSYWSYGGAQKTADNVVWAVQLAEDAFTGGGLPEENVYAQAAREIYEASGGAFNPYLGALTRLWNIGGKDGGPPRVPAREEIEEALAKAEWDYGAIGKGAACDEALLFLPSKKLAAAVINLGGNIMTYGRKPWGQPFKIALRDPGGGPNDSIGVFTLRGTHFISTSGGYEKYFVRDGKTYHHIFDPETGYPACRDPGLISVTVISDNGALGDALSTACFVLGYEDSLPLLEQYGCDALFVYEDGEVRAAGGVMAYYEAW